MTITIHSPKCKYCHLILFLEMILLRGLHFPLDGHLLLVSLIEEREGSTKKGREGREGRGREERKEGESILFYSPLAYPLHSYSQRWWVIVKAQDQGKCLLPPFTDRMPGNTSVLYLSNGYFKLYSEYQWQLIFHWVSETL